MKNLDDPGIYDELDPGGMGGLIAGFADQCRTAWDNVKRFELPERYREASAFLVLGMGGSAIGGDLLRTALEGRCRVPVLVSREYALPAWVDGGTLVVASSYSGNTEETLSAFEQARSRGARLLAITAGGSLAARAREAGAPALTYQFQGQPRAALGYSFISLLGITARLGWIADPAQDFDSALQDVDRLEWIARRDVPVQRNPAKALAEKLAGKVPVIYGSGTLGEVAHRWKTQFNENAKTTACFEHMSELNHNTVVGYEFPRTALNDFFTILLESPRADPRIQKRFEVTRTLLSQRGLAYHVVRVAGGNPLAEMLWAIHLGDYVSYYLALMNDADPTPVSAIDTLKKALAV